MITSFLHHLVIANPGPYGVARMIVYPKGFSAVAPAREPTQRKKGRSAHHLEMTRRKQLSVQELGDGKLLVDDTHEISARTGTCTVVRVLETHRGGEPYPSVEMKCGKCGGLSEVALTTWKWRARKYTEACGRCRRESASRESFGRGTLAEGKTGT